NGLRTRTGPRNFGPFRTSPNGTAGGHLGPRPSRHPSAPGVDTRCHMFTWNTRDFSRSERGHRLDHSDRPSPQLVAVEAQHHVVDALALERECERQHHVATRAHPRLLRRWALGEEPALHARDLLAVTPDDIDRERVRTAVGIRQLE